MPASSMVPPIQPGSRVRTRNLFPYLLPRGLREGIEVTVLRANDNSFVVEDDEGRECTVGPLSLDPGEMVWSDGHWVESV